MERCGGGCGGGDDVVPCLDVMWRMCDVVVVMCGCDAVRKVAL